jgi:hypothetical protein
MSDASRSRAAGHDGPPDSRHIERSIANEFHGVDHAIVTLDRTGDIGLGLGTG